MQVAGVKYRSEKSFHFSFFPPPMGFPTDATLQFNDPYPTCQLVDYVLLCHRSTSKYSNYVAAFPFWDAKPR